MMFMARGTDLVTLYIGLELMALSTYVLAGWFTGEAKSNESALKYFVLGGMSSGVLLYGLSLIYGATGSTNLVAISHKIADGGRLAALGIVFTAAGLFFKIAAAPFHVWVPDVYEGAPTPVTAFMSVGPKAAGYALLARVFYDGLAPAQATWLPLVTVVAGLTMVWGNVAALLQTNVKRMLAYSSIAHAGYALLGIVAFDREWGLPGILYYMVAYTFMNLGAFGLVVMLETRGYSGDTVDDYNGLAKRHPWAAAGMLLFLLSLAGIPPTAGFFGKYILFSAAIRTGHVPLAVIAVVTSAISLFYYFRIAAAMYLKDKEWDRPVESTPSLSFALAVCAILTIAAGVVPQRLFEWVRASLPSLTG
jgi:NADH-quinone oxidoreductase subunit N